MTVTVRPVPTPVPQASDPLNFDARADAFHAQFPGIVADMNTQNEENNTINANVNTQSALAIAAKDAAQGAANYRGVWQGMAGAMNVPASVFHLNNFWVLTSSVASVAAHEPGTSSVWQPVNGFRAGLPVMRPSLLMDFAAAQAVDSRLSFSRASTATRINARGVLEVVPANAPRIDYDPVTLACRGLLVEESRTNLLTQSAVVIGNTWNAGTNLTFIGNATAPDGSNTASTIAATGLGDAFVGQAHYFQSNTTYTMSAWIRLRSGAAPTSGYILAVDYDGEGVAGTLERARLPVAGSGLDGTWRRFSMSFANKAGIPGFAYLCVDFNPGVQIDIWGAQLEAGEFASSYIPTTTAAATRAAESVSGSDATGRWYRADEGTMLLTHAANGATGATVQEANSFYLYFLAGDRMSLRYYSFSGICQFDATAKVGGAWQTDTSGRPYPSGTFVTHAFAYKTNDAAYSINGGSAERYNTFTVPTGNATLILGGGGSQHIKRIAFYPARLPDAQLQAITAV